MRILFLNENIARGGVDTFICSLIDNWPDKEDSFEMVINYNHPGLEQLQKNLIGKVKFHIYKGLFVWDFNKYTRSESIFGKFFRLIIQYPLFLLHLFKIRKIMGSIEHDLLFVINGGYPGGDLCRAAIITSKKKVVHNVHNLAGPVQAIRYIPEKIIDHYVAKNSSKTISVSKACAQALERRVKVNSEVIYNGISIPEKEAALHSQVLACGIVGIVEPRKGQENFLYSFKKIIQNNPSLQLYFFGEGDPEYKKKLLGIISELKIESNVVFKGFCTDKNLMFDSIDILIVPSQEYESFGLVAVEAMIRKIPVVVSDIGGLPEVVENNISGFVIPHLDVDAFATKTLDLVMDEELRFEITKNAWIRVNKYFDISKMTKNYLNSCQNILNNND